MLAEGGANVIMRLSGRKLKKIDFACRSTAKNRPKNAFFFDFSKNAPDHLYISKKHVECVQDIRNAYFRPYIGHMSTYNNFEKMMIFDPKRRF